VGGVFLLPSSSGGGVGGGGVGAPPLFGWVGAICGRAARRDARAMRTVGTDDGKQVATASGDG